MTQQEIKANMTQGTWVYASKDMTSINYGSIDCWTLDNIGNTHNTVANAAAITHAINNTYGNGINPESVGDMFNALQVAQKYFESTGPLHLAKDIEDIIKNATL
jgi:formate dehydrogenase assembly factor FdhD